ncbi:hypothetical protein CHS0354_035483 [Potamilus streckersoni]|uniref:Uncharacterized protein n=1 Tax=Potamilus streckersoni TaxID=2493646 RepID=A0AAE0VJZ4_9BIVA|nr:hypothetical protein CHS0354_035483 [Potamilus streckersoni]
MMKATLAYINIAKIKTCGMSDRRKYELYRSWLRIASANIDTDSISGRVKFAGILWVLGKTINATKTLNSIIPRPLFDIGIKDHMRHIFHKPYMMTKTGTDYSEAVITRLGRDKYVQKVISLDARYTMEEIYIIPNVIKYELFHVPNLSSSRLGAIVDSDLLRYYLLYKCHIDLGNKSNSNAAFINLIEIASQERFDPYMKHREVALNVLGLCYLEKKDYLRGYICFCRSMSLHHRLLIQHWSMSTPWHLAVLVSKLINGVFSQIDVPFKMVAHYEASLYSKRVKARCERSQRSSRDKY